MDVYPMCLLYESSFWDNFGWMFRNTTRKNWKRSLKLVGFMVLSRILNIILKLWDVEGLKRPFQRLRLYFYPWHICFICYRPFVQVWIKIRGLQSWLNNQTETLYFKCSWSFSELTALHFTSCMNTNWSWSDSNAATIQLIGLRKPL